MSVGGPNFNDSGLFSQISNICCPSGYVRIVYNIPPSKEDEASTAINEVLKSIWSNIDNDESTAQFCTSLLAEFGLNLQIEKLARGLNPNASLTADLIVKDKGDLAEVMGYIHERDFRLVPEYNIFAPVTFEKRKAGTTIPGIDVLAFVLEDVDSEVLSNHEYIFICEQKHTSDSSSIAVPSRDAKLFFNNLSFPKFFQEIVRVRSMYKKAGLVARRRRTLLFLPEFAKRSERIRLVSLVVFDSEIDVDKASAEIETHLVKPLTEQEENRYNPENIEVILFPVDNFRNFHICCYKDLRPYSNESAN